MTYVAATYRAPYPMRADLSCEREPQMPIDLLILAVLRRRPQHGYELKKSIEAITADLFPLSNSLLYPALRRFEEMGAVQREVVPQEGKPDRHLYHLTDRGTEVMQSLLRDFPPEVARRDGEFWVRASFFGLLEPTERLEILRARKQVLERRLANFPRLRALESDEQAQDFLSQVLAFREQRFQHELAWIEEAMQTQQRLL